MPASPRFQLADLPLVLSGPILRRTTYSEVSVWIALKSADNLYLTVYDETGAIVTQSYSTPTISLGAHLHVCVLNAVASLITPLLEGVNYTYDINFSSTIAGTLNTVGILEKNSAGIGLITFAGSGFSLPSFSLPPSDLNKLHLAHASCRKPHGEGMDALEGLHDMIVKAIVNPVPNTNLQKAEGRPHQLFLTGDQIYSDDVADALLLLLQDAATTLLGWSEGLPGSLIAPGPGYRSDFMNDNAEFTTDSETGKSHLIKLEEFYCMYMFAFSDVLWTVLPTLAEVLITPFIGDFSAFDDECIYLTNYSSTLGKVRKALANVPVYMIFDDHEITDDWYLNGQWYDDVTGSQLGNKIIANGLSAYAVFQDWGNRPSYYTYGAGLNLLLKLTATTGIPPDFNAIQNIVLPDALPGPYKILTPKAGGMTWHYTIEMPMYEVLVLDSRTMRGFSGANKAFPALIDPSNMAAQIPPPYSANVQLTIIVSPAPVFGMPRIEEIQDPTIEDSGLDVHLKNYWWIKKQDGEAWGLRTNDVLQDLLAHFTRRATAVAGYKGRIVILSGDVHYGFSIRTQYWAKDPEGQGFAALTPPDEYNIVMAQLTASSLKNEVNSWKGSYNVHHNGYEREIVTGNILAPIIYYGDDSSGGLKIIGQQTGLPIPPAQIPAPPPVTVHRGEFFNPINSVNTGNNTIQRSYTGGGPDWRYRIDFMFDDRPPLSRGAITPTPITQAVSSSPPAALATYAVSATQYIDKTLAWGHGLESVGTNNIGEITFDWPSTGDAQKVIHTLWWRLNNAAAMSGDLTIHNVSLSYSDTKYLKP